jgi:hypothetical protein
MKILCFIIYYIIIKINFSIKIKILLYLYEILKMKFHNDKFKNKIFI